MRILVPLNSMEHVDDYIASGAGEFYIGFYDEQWTNKFGDFADINRMSGFKENANPFSLEEVIEIIKCIREKGQLVYVTFNSSIYSEEQLDEIKKYMVILKENNVDGVIVSCIELVEIANKLEIPIVVSTIAGVYNMQIASFYRDKGAKRIIIPRDMSVDEIEMIVNEVQEVEYEVFMMRNGCMFSDANCLGMHRTESCSICGSLINASSQIKIKDDDFQKRHRVELNDIIYTKAFHEYACGLCSIYRFIKMNIAACKIVGRTDEWKNVCNDIRYVKQNIEIAQSCKSQEEYLKRMQLPEESRTMCKLGLSCYYPEMRF
ncbi:peptidase U32 family protein [Anaerosporobacter sp.]|uniref:peptidase U32 family protein n=1 Tax=Anaerosporobacter sp. TaxID=1872529 RepID=UPI00286F1CC5|nr:U32 family peptidase [Anaerosporobacter sp.]